MARDIAHQQWIIPRRYTAHYIERLPENAMEHIRRGRCDCTFDLVNCFRTIVESERHDGQISEYHVHDRFADIECIEQSELKHAVPVETIRPSETPGARSDGAIDIIRRPMGTLVITSPVAGLTVS
jgi:hypothetical protein